MNSMQYEKLPLTLRIRVKSEDFLSAYLIDDSGRIIVWVVNNQLGKQEELEYSGSEDKLLSADERKNAMPVREDLVFPELGVEVSLGYRLEEGTNVLYEVCKISSIESREVIATVSQIYFSPYRNTLEDMVKGALDKYRFPQIYEGWREGEKIDYWAGVLYRLRRQTGEFGGQEDDVFEKSLLDQMKQLDSDIIRLLPGCLRRLASLEQIDEGALVRSFEARTGCGLI